MVAKNLEIELKLLVGRADLKRLLASPLLQRVLRADSEQKRHLVSSYYDTAALDFKQHGLAYRVRDKGDGSYEATVKTAKTADGGVTERLELNLPLRDAEPVLDGFGALGLDCELRELAPDGVQKLFTVDLERTTYLLDIDGGVAELAIDRGRIIAGKKRALVDEMELELVTGEKGALLAFAAQAAAVVPLFVEKRSKFARGLALLGVTLDAADAKIRMDEAGNARSEILRAAGQRCARLLELQNSFKSGTATRETARRATRELFYLRSLLHFSTAFAVEAISGGEETIVQRWLEALAQMRLVLHLQKLWRRISKRGGVLLGNNVLGARLDTARQAAVSALRELAAAGSLSQAAYGILAWLHQRQWQNEEYLQMESAVRCRLQDWQEDLEKAVEAQEQAMVLADMLCLMKSMEDKSFLKGADAKRKELRRLLVAVRAERIPAILRSLERGSSSKVLSRDLGAVAGWLLAKKKL